jgi:aryl-alcohol dehydrogenase-like predicted oxidoreductase
MRLNGAGDVAGAARIIDHALELGITSFHCSSEYETFPLFEQAWSRRQSRDAGSVIAKVGVPHFGEPRFSARAFREKVDSYLKSLSIERLEVVQWLLRYDLRDEDGRQRILAESEEEISALVADLKRSGKIAALVSFPYTQGIADAVLQMDFCDGLALYVNPLEREMDEAIHSAARLGKGVLAIRPYAAGRVFSETDLAPSDALDHVFGFPAVLSAVVSASSAGHLDTLHRYASSHPLNGRHDVSL